jgi:hypothetical protein
MVSGSVKITQMFAIKKIIPLPALTFTTHKNRTLKAGMELDEFVLQKY